VFVTRLLDALDETPLAGDLAEESHHDRSSGWFWRQAINGIAHGMIRQIRRHPVLTTRAVLLLWAMTTAVRWAFVVAGLDRVLLYTFAAQPLRRGHLQALSWMGLSFIAFVVGGPLSRRRVCRRDDDPCTALSPRSRIRL